MIALTTPSQSGLLERVFDSAAKAIHTMPGKLWFFIAAICAVCIIFVLLSPLKSAK